MSNASMATTRLGSADTGITESVHSGTSQRPDDTMAKDGTYTCTFHDCTLRFATPKLLQGHKRESHRQAHHLYGPRPPVATGMTSSLLNIQAGPHRCDRFNPSTGKHCNAVFSRPYDLTRHEATIHDPGKQKARCHMCTGGKTFSREDACIRHFKVCHPGVECPVKRRRRGGSAAGRHAGSNVANPEPSSTDDLNAKVFSKTVAGQPGFIGLSMASTTP
ncbi:hypothetical protein VTI74DRAFT_11253 [Chaetomium olivicolor]